jgi:hypothetical protein
MEETQHMNTDSEKYLEDCRKFSPAIAFCLAFRRRIPKKYETKVIALVKAYPRIAEDLVLETNTAILGLLWGCSASKVPRHLRLMTARNQGDITYSLGEPEPMKGLPVRMVFSIPEESVVEA